MDSVKIPYSQYLNGYNSINFRDFRAASPNLTFVTPDMQNGSSRESQTDINMNGHREKHPVYEIQSYDFDRWGVINSRYVFNGRHAGYSQYIAFDGMGLKLDETDMDILRNSIAQLVDYEQHDLFLDSDRYIKVAEEGQELDEGSFVLKLNGSHEMPRVSKEVAYLIMRIWQNCWQRMSALMDGTGIYMDHNIELYIPKMFLDPVKACVDVFQNWLAKVLPPQVMSMISIAVGATFSEQKWDDSACKILVDGTVASEFDRNSMFCLDMVEDGVPSAIEPPKGWQNSMNRWENILVDYIAAGKLPRYFDFIEKAMLDKRCTSGDEQRTGTHNVVVRADYDLLSRCMAAEVYLDMSDDEFGYDEFASVNNIVGQMANILQNNYGFGSSDVHYLMRDMECRLVERAAQLGEKLGEYEFKDFAFIYSEVEQSDTELAGKILAILSKQCRYADTNNLISEDEEIIANPNIYFNVLSTEIAEDLDGTRLDREGFNRWVGLYESIENSGKDAALEMLTEKLCHCLRFDDEGPSPLVIAEENNLSNVITGQVRGLIADYSERKNGKLSYAEYNQVLELYTDYRYSARLNDKANAQAKELLCAQYGFSDDTAIVADILAAKELVELWNSCVDSECRNIQSRAGMFEDADFDLWSERLRYAAINSDVADGIIKLIVDKTPREKAKAYITKASEKDLIALEEQLVSRQLGVAASSENLLSTDDFKWWIARYADAVSNAKPFEDNIFATLEKVRLKEKDSDILDIVRDEKQWKLLGSLVCREAPGVKVLNTERYDKWIAIYNDLQNADSDVDQDAITACEDLLSQRINYDTIKRLELIRDQGSLFWTALERLADNQMQSTGIMKVSEFESWLRYLKDAENEGNPVAGKIRKLLNAQCRLRDEGEAGTRQAYDAALEAQCNDTQLLTELIRTEFNETINESGVRNMAHVKRWLGLYNFLNNQGDSFAETVADKLCERSKVEGKYVLDVAREEKVSELEQKLIKAEYKDLPETNSIRDMEALRRWMQHYVTMRTIGDVEMEKAIADKICQRPILDGQYVLETVLNCGGEDLEDEMLECEKNAARAYNTDEYKYRLDRYFANHYSDMYLELLSAKGNRADNLDRFIAYLRDNTLGTDCVRNGGDLLEKLAKDTRQYSIDTINSFREICGIDSVKGMLRANQPVLEQLLSQAVQNGMNMDDMQCFYVLRDSSAGRMSSIDDRAADELADALVNCDADYNTNNFNSYFKNGVDDSVAAHVRDGVTSRLSTRKVTSQVLDNAAKLLNEVHMPITVSVDIMGELLAKTSDKVDLNVLLDFVVNRDISVREQMVMLIVQWMRSAEDQPSGNLDAIIAFTGKLHGEALDRVSPQLFSGVRSYLANGNSCENAEFKTYERVLQLWGERSDITDIIYPMLNDCVVLTDTRTEYVRAQLANGPLNLDEKYAAIIACRNTIETGSLADILRTAESVDDFIEATAADKLPWLDDEGFTAIAANEDISGSITAIVERELSRKMDENRVNGSKTSILNGLCDMVIKVNELNSLRSIRDNLAEKLNAGILQRIPSVFDECVKLFDKQSVGETTNALNRLKGLLNRVGVDATQPISVSTVEWCESYVNAVVHGTQDARIVREIHANRCDFGALRNFVKRVYDSCISRETFTEDQIIVLLASAKVMDLNNVWTRYILMAARMPQERDNIWISGMEVSVVMHVVYAYNKLDNIGDDIVSADTLADYCASDENFANQQRKQKNKELKAILDRGRGEDNKSGGLFGLFRKRK